MKNLMLEWLCSNQLHKKQKQTHIGELDLMKCANCGNVNADSLWDEGDTIYCSKCCHRTLIETGEDDLVECPRCHEMRDRKAYYCRNCGEH